MTEANDRLAIPGFDRLKAAFDGQGVALFLDVDGTLLEIAARPDAVRVPQPLLEVLQRLSERNQGAVALVSGRSLDALDRLFAPLTVTAAGLHGVERRDASGLIHAPDHSGGLDGVRRFLSANADRDVLIEDKGSALVLHYRESPALEQHCRELAQAALAHCHDGWRVVPGKMSFEIRQSAIGKSDAIEAFLREPPFAGRSPAFFGDDETDEDGFAAVNGRGGWSFLVGPPHKTLATGRVADPEAVYELLCALLDSHGPPDRNREEAC